ncbi:hypothetical protein MRX96_046551 [Rhipicephalus microplus]|uniref:Uncharacterized protein n=1 Tax=Rhipicephalus microplus TaxID=6941 RepID=A0A9J6E6D7_RHIMP|nr:hypothetical protein HPB51_002093 [Rhipicephalus microplus]
MLIPGPIHGIRSGIRDQRETLECGLTPAEILQGRRLRTQLPDYQCGPSHRVVKHRQSRPSTQPLAPLHEGDVVRVQSGSWAIKARVLKPSTYPRSYHVITQEGRCLRRNRKHLQTDWRILPAGLCSQREQRTAKHLDSCTAHRRHSVKQ